MTLLHPAEKFPNLAVTPIDGAALELSDVRRLRRDYGPVGLGKETHDLTTGGRSPMSALSEPQTSPLYTPPGRTSPCSCSR